MRNVCLEQIFELAKRDKRVVFIGSDIGVGLIDKYRAELPEQFFMEGISEQNLVGVAAGMAREGRIVYLAAIACFFKRALEQIELDVCLHNLPVRLIAFGAGLAHSCEGPTHLSLNDIALMRALPNMGIIAPADRNEAARVIQATADYPGPLYIRLGHGARIVTDERPFEMGKAYVMRRATCNPAVIISTGNLLGMAIEASNLCDVGLLHIPTIKPIDKRAIEIWLQHMRRTGVVTVEEHSVIGGLGSAVAEIIAESNYPVRLKRLGLPGEFIAGYGPREYMLARYGLTAEGIAAAVKEMQ